LAGGGHRVGGDWRGTSGAKRVPHGYSSGRMPSSSYGNRAAMADNYDDDDDGDDYEDEEYSSGRRSRKRNGLSMQAEQVVPGVPNELLLPGAIVTLAVVIVGVFTIARLTAR